MWPGVGQRTALDAPPPQLLQPALLRGGTFDSKRVLYVHARDGLEDKLEPDDIGACLALPVSTLRKATLTAISDILKKLGEVMDTSAEKGQERFLLFAALELTRAGAAEPHFQSKSWGPPAPPVPVCFRFASWMRRTSAAVSGWAAKPAASAEARSRRSPGLRLPPDSGSFKGML